MTVAVQSMKRLFKAFFELIGYCGLGDLNVRFVKKLNYTSVLSTPISSDPSAAFIISLSALLPPLFCLILLFTFIFAITALKN